ncbi:MAG: hypothetical protein A2172_04765 [Candidatus Woykebacteria bacterium RBG_13_40_15]|uniref:Uncharacterized protein n=1 Tax=Candidatus Woykebacteria bacterium RBG_13_40_15 TaxID=1802593 RepID=A0A1G1W744_9BACT|nr:MAG: hypothetical protein A2172_04765 [Candidatus Woykebacteria bacterium RBG_13_40_15]
MRKGLRERDVEETLITMLGVYLYEALLRMGLGMTITLTIQATGGLSKCVKISRVPEGLVVSDTNIDSLPPHGTLIGKEELQRRLPSIQDLRTRLAEQLFVSDTEEEFRSKAEKILALGTFAGRPAGYEIRKVHCKGKKPVGATVYVGVINQTFTVWDVKRLWEP